MLSLQNAFHGKEGVRMAFSPNDSRQSGGGLLVIAFSDESPLRNDAQYFVAFEGSYLRHLVTVLRVNHVTFHSHIPEHRVAETVNLSVLMVREGSIRFLASSPFRYLPDPVERFAEFLVGSVYEPRSLENINHLKSDFRDVFRYSESRLDTKLSQCISRINLPEGWHMLGPNSHNPVAQETLLHLCARLGLRWTAQYLIRLPGGQEASRLANIEDDTPADLSTMYGNMDMADLFMGKITCWSGDPPWYELKKPLPPTKIHRINPDIFVITSNLEESQKTLYDDIALMQEVCRARQQPPAVVRERGQRSQSAVDAPLNALGVASSQHASESNPRMRSKSEGIVKFDDGSSSSSSRPGAFAVADSQENDSSRPLVGRHRSEPSQAYGYQGRHHAVVTAADYYYMQNSDVTTNPVGMETIQSAEPGSSACTTDGGTATGYRGNDGYLTNVTTGDTNTPILEESLRKLQQIRSDLREKQRDYHQQRHLVKNQDDRKENLQRFSTSCPSLPDSVSPEPELQEASDEDPEVNHDGVESHEVPLITVGHPSEGCAVRSPMPYAASHAGVNSALCGVAGSMDDSLNRSSDHHNHHRRHQDTASGHHQDITICINDVTVDSTSDYMVPPGGSDEVNAAIIEQIKKANKRRSSWCPEQGRKKEEKQEKQKMLNISGRSQSLSSLDGDSDEDEEDEDDDGSGAYQNIPSDAAQTSYSSSPGRSPGGSGVLSSGASANSSLTSITRQSHVTTDDLSASLQSNPLVANSATIQTMSPANGHMSHSGPIPTGDSCLSPSDDPNILMYPNSLAKASSSPSIASEHHHVNKDLHSSDFPEQNRTSCHQSGGEETEEDSDSKAEGQGALLEHAEAVMAADEEEDQPKIEKKRKSSVFSKLGSYRQKNKVVKDTKLLRNNTHHFVGVCFSNSTPCDVCSKSMSNKLALQCENCMVNVHENSCKDQIATCAKYRASRVGNGDSLREKKSSSLPAECVNNTLNLKSSQSFKETRRAISVPGHPTPQSSASLHVPTPRSSSPSNVSSVGSSGPSPWRRVASRLGIDSPIISEERDKAKDDEPVQSSPQFLDTTTITDSMSASTESLEEGSGLLADIDEDYVEECEAWSVTVDKKTLKKMSAKDIKRQDHIWELIQTERSHCHTLKIMQRVFSHGMRHEVNMRQDQIDKIFPCLGELFDIHTTFLHRLTERQSLRADRSIDEIGDILLQQFDGEMGERMKVAYGAFCSQHAMAVQLYKDILKCDKKFQNFIKKCSQSPVCKRLGIPECILLVTQRVTKYPLMIEPIIKTTKDNKTDKERLLKALPLIRQILVYIDARVDAHEKYQRLLEIYNKLDARSYAMYMGKKFKKSNLLLGDRKLMHEGYMRWMTARGKSFEVLAVILSDVMFFLAENNQKLTFFSQDSKSSVVPLSKLLVREKGDTRDSKGIYLICQSKTEPEMYEFICRSAEERKTWIKVIRAAVLKCMEVEGIDISKMLDVEGEKKELEAKSARIRQLVDRLYERDNIIKQKCDEKMNIIIEMLEVFSKEEINKNLQNVYKEESADSIDHNVWSVLKHAVQDSSNFLSLLFLGSSESTQVQGTGNTERSVCVTALPRRAETFSGFDQKEKVKRRYDGDQLSDGNRSGSQLSLNETESSSQNVDSSQTDRHAKEKAKNQGQVMKVNTLDRDTDRSSPDPESRDMSRDLPHNLAAVLREVTTNPSKGQCECLAQLLQYLYGLVCITSNQLTEVEKLRAQLTEANNKVSNLYAENKRLSHGFHHDKQLEILREQQEALRQQRTELDRLREFDRKEREEERVRMKEEKEQLEKEKAELQCQKEEIQHQKEILQRQMDLFEENKRRLLQQTAESPRNVSMRERSESPGSRGVSPASRGSQSSLLDASHGRSGSDDATHGPSPDRVPDGGVNPVPIHLLSATNERKLAPVLPLKSPAAALGGATGKQQGASGVQQVLPLKLSTGSLSSPSCSGSRSTLDGAGRALTHSQSQRALVSVTRTSSGTRVPPGAAALAGPGNILPMKLAEKPRPKSASSPPTAPPHGAPDKPHSHKRSSSAAKKDEEVIYF